MSAITFVRPDIGVQPALGRFFSEDDDRIGLPRLFRHIKPGADAADPWREGNRNKRGKQQRTERRQWTGLTYDTVVKLMQKR